MKKVTENFRRDLTPARRRVRRWPMPVAFVAGTLGTGFAILTSNPSTAQITSPPTTPAGVTNEISADRLSGKWQRAAGNFGNSVLEIRGVAADGHLDAAYFNPRLINVSRAEWHSETNGLSIFVELQDAGYPSATYRLHYLSKEDRLKGKFFQPLHNQTFSVSFVRVTNSPATTPPK